MVHPSSLMLLEEVLKEATFLAFKLSPSLMFLLSLLYSVIVGTHGWCDLCCGILKFQTLKRLKD